MNQRKLGIFLSYLNITLQSLLGFLYIPILLHYIGKSEYGLYQLMGSLIAYFGIMDFGLSAAVIRFYAKYLALKDRGAWRISLPSRFAATERDAHRGRGGVYDAGCGLFGQHDGGRGGGGYFPFAPLEYRDHSLDDGFPLGDQCT